MHADEDAGEVEVGDGGGERDEEALGGFGGGVVVGDFDAGLVGFAEDWVTVMVWQFNNGCDSR